MVIKALQKVTSDLQSSMHLVKSVQRYLVNITSDQCKRTFRKKSVLLLSLKKLNKKENEDEPVQAIARS